MIFKAHSNLFNEETYPSPSEKLVIEIMKLINTKQYTGSALQAVAYSFDMVPLEPNDWEPPGNHEGLLPDIFEMIVEHDASEDVFRTALLKLGYKPRNIEHGKLKTNGDSDDVRMVDIEDQQDKHHELPSKQGDGDS